MNRIKILVCAAAGLALAAAAWFLADVRTPSATVSADILSRSVGLALLGIAMIAAGWVFRASARTEPNPASRPGRLPISEYRRGFNRIRGDTQARRRASRDVVLSLRRAVAEHGDQPMPVGTDSVFRIPENERLQDMLHRRAAQLGDRTRH